MMIDGIPNQPLYFYQKDIVGKNLETRSAIWIDETFSNGAANGFTRSTIESKKPHKSFAPISGGFQKWGILQK